MGSAKIKGASLSENLARACAARLQREGVAAELHIARARAGSSEGRFAMIINCGFPEPEQTRTAMRMTSPVPDVLQTG